MLNVDKRTIPADFGLGMNGVFDQGVNEFFGGMATSVDNQEYCKIQVNEIDIEPSMISSLNVGDQF